MNQKNIIKFDTEKKAKKFYDSMKGLQSKYSRTSYYLDGEKVGRF